MYVYDFASTHVNGMLMCSCERENADCQVVASLRPAKRRTTCRLNISFIKHKCKRRSV